MDIREALKRGCEALGRAGNDDPKPDVQALLLTALQEERTVLIAHPERELTPKEENTYMKYISERALGKPVSYITGVKEFMGLAFAVNEAVLIPRPETELLVEEAVKILKDTLSVRCADSSPGGGAKDTWLVWKMTGGDSSPGGEAKGIPRDREGKGDCDLLQKDADIAHYKTDLASPPGRGGSRRLTERGPRVLDLCTGSGAIAISIKHFVPRAEVTATDLSEEALGVARGNAGRILGDGDERREMGDGRMGERYGVKMAEETDEIRFLQGDLFEVFSNLQSPICNLQTPDSELFNLIVSNPPYIPSEVIGGLMPDVKDFEPKMALDGGEDGLEIYRRLIPEAAGHLAPGGVLLLEIGHDQGETVPELCRKAGFTNITVLKDLAGLDRVVRAEGVPCR